MCCRKNSLLITEDDRTHILNLYGLLKEEVTESEGIINIKADSTFPAGYYTQLSSEGEQELKTGLKEAQRWMTENKDSLISVQIQAGESQITNFDQEQDPPKWVKPYVLSQQRANTLKRILIPYFEDLVSKGVLSAMPIFESPLIEIGKTPYKQGETTITPDLRAKYNKEQYCRVVMKLIQPGKCAVGLEVEVSYNSKPNANFPCRGGHKCDVARFQVLVNNVPIGEANLNNAKDGASKTSGKLTVKPENAEAIAAFSRDSLTVSLKCLSGAKCHSGTPEVKISKKGNEGQPATVLWDKCSPALARGDERQFDILKLDPCGNVVESSKADASNKDATEPPPLPGSTTATTASTQVQEYHIYPLELTNMGKPTAFESVEQIVKFLTQVDNKYGGKGLAPLVGGKFDINKGFNADKTEWNGKIQLGSEWDYFVFDPTGKDAVGPKSWTNMTPLYLNLDKGSVISKVVSDRTKATNPPPGWPSKILVAPNESFSSGNWHVEYEEKYDANKKLVRVTTSDGYYSAKLVPGKSKKTKDEEDAQKTKDEETAKANEAKRVERDTTLKVKTFKMDGEDKIEDFEEYFKDYMKKRDDLNLGTGKDYYEVTATKMTYGGNVYNKGQIIRLTT
jgi:hypothetical protein